VYKRQVLGNHEAMLLLADKILDEDWEEPIRNPLRIAKEQVSKRELGWAWWVGLEARS
jgi:hypothetical protein